MALNCGNGSSLLKALVKAFDKLHIVLAAEFRVLRFEVQPVDLRQQASWRFQLAVDERRVQDQPRGIVGDLGLPPQFNLALQGSKFRWILSTPTESVSIRLKLLVCLARTGVKSPLKAMLEETNTRARPLPILSTGPFPYCFSLR